MSRVIATTVFVHLSVKLVKVEIVVGVFTIFFCVKTFLCSKKERIPFIVSFVVIHAFCLWLDINVQKCIKGDSDSGVIKVKIKLAESGVFMETFGCCFNALI